MPIEPAHYAQNEAWLLFRLTETPVHTVEDGDFEVFALLDVATGLMLGMEFVEASAPEPSALQSRRLLGSAAEAAGRLPERIYLDADAGLEAFSAALAAMSIEACPESAAALAPLTQEARDGFRAHMGGGPAP